MVRTFISRCLRARRGFPAALAALSAGLALRLLFVHFHPEPQGDTLLYGAFAKNLLLHGVYGFKTPGGFQPTLIRLPGYPLFLALCFRLFGMENYTAAMYAQVLVDQLSCALIAATAAVLFGRKAGLAALWIAALCPFTANYVAAPLTETLSIFCVALAFWSLLRWCSDLAVGRGLGPHFWLIVLALGYAILLRPDGGLLAAAVCPAMLAFAWKLASPKRAITLVLLCGVCSLLPLTPWAERNWRDFHVFQPLAPLAANDPGEFVAHGFDRWYRSWAIDYASNEEVYWQESTDAIDIRNLPDRAFDNAEQREQTAALLEDYDQDTDMTPELDARFEAIARQRIAARPVRYYVGLPLARLANMWLRPRLEMLPFDARWWENPADDPRQAAVAVAAIALNLLYLAAAFWGAWKVWRGGAGLARAMLWPMVAFVILRSALLATLDNSEPRYTLECFPVVLILAAAAAARPTSSRDES